MLLEEFDCTIEKYSLLTKDKANEIHINFKFEGSRVPRNSYRTLLLGYFKEYTVAHRFCNT